MDETQVEVQAPRPRNGMTTAQGLNFASAVGSMMMTSMSHEAEVKRQKKVMEYNKAMNDRAYYSNLYNSSPIARAQQMRDAGLNPLTQELDSGTSTPQPNPLAYEPTAIGMEAQTFKSGIDSMVSLIQYDRDTKVKEDELKVHRGQLANEEFKLEENVKQYLREFFTQSFQDGRIGPNTYKQVMRGLTYDSSYGDVTNLEEENWMQSSERESAKKALDMQGVKLDQEQINKDMLEISKGIAIFGGDTDNPYLRAKIAKALMTPNGKVAIYGILNNGDYNADDIRQVETILKGEFIYDKSSEAVTDIMSVLMGVKKLKEKKLVIPNKGGK